MKIYIVILTVLTILTGRNNQKFNNEKTQTSDDTTTIVNLLLKKYCNLSEVSLCRKSLDYNQSSIVTSKKSLKEALQIELIEQFQKFSPGYDPDIKKFLNKQDLDFMRDQTNGRIKWKETELNQNVDLNDCKSKKTHSQNISLAISKPLFNESKNYSLVYITESDLEYTVTLVLLKKNEKSWQKIFSLNM